MEILSNIGEKTYLIRDVCRFRKKYEGRERERERTEIFFDPIKIKI